MNKLSPALVPPLTDAPFRRFNTSAGEEYHHHRRHRRCNHHHHHCLQNLLKKLSPAGGPLCSLSRWCYKTLRDETNYALWSPPALLILPFHLSFSASQRLHLGSLPPPQHLCYPLPVLSVGSCLNLLPHQTDLRVLMAPWPPKQYACEIREHRWSVFRGSGVYI